MAARTALPRDAAALSALLDRRPDLVLPLVLKVLPPPRAERDPAERLGIDLAAVRTAGDAGHALETLWAALRRGEIGPAEAARLADRVWAEVPAQPSLAELRRRLARVAERLPGVRDGPRKAEASPATSHRVLVYLRAQG